MAQGCHITAPMGRAMGGFAQGLHVGVGVRTHDLAHTRRTLYHWTTDTPNTIFFYEFSFNGLKEFKRDCFVAGSYLKEFFMTLTDCVATSRHDLAMHNIREGILLVMC